MRISIFSSLCVIGVCVARISIPDTCKETLDSDEVVCNHLNNPVESNCEKVFNDIKSHFLKVEKLIKCIKKDKNATMEACGEYIMEGEPNFMKIEFDYWKLMNGFKWNMTQVNTYMDWRDKSLYLWQKVDEASGRNSVYPKYK
ncbi:hypothetical protein J6590_026077 [Homalodisca vitripennis]|nr:hypothetical protein J6590_026077 [Homalodisca vitripennis]